MICVYQIRNTKTGKVYVGGTVNKRNRWGKHRHDLRHGVSKNKNLQRDWDNFGEESFEFEVLEETSEELLREKEQYWIDELNSVEPTGYNHHKSSFSGKGYKWRKESRERASGSHKGKTLSEEHKAKIMETKIKNKTLNPMLGKTHSDEAKKKMSEAKRGKPVGIGEANSNAKMTEQQVKGIIADLITGQLSPKEISDKYGVSHKKVSSVNTRKTWAHVTFEGYEHVKCYRHFRKSKVK